jgi:hypothetical protein
MPKIVLIDDSDAEVLAPVVPTLLAKGVGKFYTWNDASRLSAAAQKVIGVSHPTTATLLDAKSTGS